MKKLYCLHLINSKFSQNYNQIILKNSLGTRIISQFLNTSSINQNDDNNLPDQDEHNEILKTYYIPGRYLHYFKKSRRQLKKEESHFGDEVYLLT